MELVDRWPENPFFLGNKALTLAKAGRTEEARETLHEMREAQAQGAEYRCQMAAVHLAMGEKEIALDLLEEVVAQEGLVFTWFYNQFDWETLRDDPRYQAVCRKVGLLK